MGNCCPKCKKKPPPTIFSVTGNQDLVDIEHERVRQAAIALNVGKGPTKVEGKIRIGFERESCTRYKRHPPEERSGERSSTRGSQESVYKYIPAVPTQNTPLPMKKEFNIPRFNETKFRRNSQ